MKSLSRRRDVGQIARDGRAGTSKTVSFERAD
jgi:hypothetical protein